MAYQLGGCPDDFLPDRLLGAAAQALGAGLALRLRHPAAAGPHRVAGHRASQGGADVVQHGGDGHHPADQCTGGLCQARPGGHRAAAARGDAQAGAGGRRRRAAARRVRQPRRGARARAARLPQGRRHLAAGRLRGRAGGGDAAQRARGDRPEGAGGEGDVERQEHHRLLLPNVRQGRAPLPCRLWHLLWLPAGHHPDGDLAGVRLAVDPHSGRRCGGASHQLAGAQVHLRAAAPRHVGALCVPGDLPEAAVRGELRVCALPGQRGAGEQQDMGQHAVWQPRRRLSGAGSRAHAAVCGASAAGGGRTGRAAVHQRGGGRGGARAARPHCAPAWLHRQHAGPAAADGEQAEADDAGAV
mmetsp:Transcript_5783/g.14627  ORF Transcript_5783/g.14627 Transcript_5783/m.14627 type:complete len:357 (+) Transcript_5783:3-1073(+)